MDHTGMRGEHFSYASTLALFIAPLFNRHIDILGLCITLLLSHKAGDPTHLQECYGGLYSGLAIWLSDWEGAQHFSEEGGVSKPSGRLSSQKITLLYHTFTFRILARVHGHCLCVICRFLKSIWHNAPRQATQKLQRTLGVPSEIIWGIVALALYERVVDWVPCPGRHSDEIASPIGFKQVCSLSPTLFGLYFNEISVSLSRLIYGRVGFWHTVGFQASYGFSTQVLNT